MTFRMPETESMEMVCFLMKMFVVSGLVSGYSVWVSVGERHTSGLASGYSLWFVVGARHLWFRYGVSGLVSGHGISSLVTASLG